MDIAQIHKKMILEGKCTLVFGTGVVMRREFNTMAVMFDGRDQEEVMVQVVISGAVGKSLEVLVGKIEGIVRGRRERMEEVRREKEREEKGKEERKEERKTQEVGGKQK